MSDKPEGSGAPPLAPRPFDAIPWLLTLLGHVRDCDYGRCKHDDPGYCELARKKLCDIISDAMAGGKNEPPSPPSADHPLQYVRDFMWRAFIDRERVAEIELYKAMARLDAAITAPAFTYASEGSRGPPGVDSAWAAGECSGEPRAASSSPLADLPEKEK